MKRQGSPRAGEQRRGPTIECVSSGYMSGGCSCKERIPASVVAAAWAGELERGPAESRFFDVPWQGRSWLAFGLADGETRGVYCPSHRAEREGRFPGLEAETYGPARASA